MLRIHSRPFLDSLAVVTMLKQLTQDRDIRKVQTYDDGLLQTQAELVGLLQTSAREAQMPLTAGSAGRLKDFLEMILKGKVPGQIHGFGPFVCHVPPPGLMELVRLIDEVTSRLRDELHARVLLAIPVERTHYYEMAQPFGEKVNDAFPDAIDDIEGAAKCLALGQGTAGVMHLMRVMEAGLKALATALKIPYAPSWESYLKQIQNRIDAKRKTKGIRWKRDEPFFRDVSGDLISIKQAWRNPSMHIVRKYSPDEAEEIFVAVRRLMQRLAEKPGSNPPASSSSPASP